MNNKKKAQNKKKEKNASSSSAVKITSQQQTLPPHHQATSSSPPANVSSQQHTTHPPRPPPPASATTSSSLGVSFQVLYVETSLTYNYSVKEQDVGLPAQELIDDACMQVCESLCPKLQTHATLDAFPSFPASSPNGKAYSIKDWARLSNPFVCLALPCESKDEGLVSQRDALQQMNDSLIRDGIKSLGAGNNLQSCEGCQEMRGALAHITKAVERLSAENQSLKESSDAMRNVRRRIIVEKARAKAIEHLEGVGIKLGNETWIAFFFRNQHILQESFGVSDGLMKLLKFGKGQLHATVHEAGYLELAEAVTSMENGGERIEFEEAYLYYFGFSADSVFANDK